jgi:gluconokinase
MANVPGLRSPYDKVGRIVYFGRMIDKIGLHSAGKLPADYVSNLGDDKPGMFDTRCCRFLRVSYADIRKRTQEGGGDEAVLEWTEARGGRRDDGECEVWNAFMIKRGWHDRQEHVARLRFRVDEAGLQDKPIQTFFDFIDFDEGRDPVASKAWEQV